jgi:L1 cell adhesion molecule like protein
MKVLGMSSIDSVPTLVVPSDAWMLDDSARKSLLMQIASSVVDDYVHLEADFKKQSLPGDAVYLYACEVISLGLTYFEFLDSIKEGDGDRLMLVWKYLLLIFKASNRKNYSNEALSLLTQVNFTLPPQLAAAVKWSRFINTSGLPGNNISCDLHIEHLNRTIKTSIQGLGSNKFQKSNHSGWKVCQFLS